MQNNSNSNSDITPREHKGTERDTEGVGQDIYATKAIFSLRELHVCFPRRPHRLQPRSEVFSEKANFNNGGFVLGTHKHFSWGYKRTLFFVV